jgi:hypothetical protein
MSHDREITCPFPTRPKLGIEFAFATVCTVLGSCQMEDREGHPVYTLRAAEILSHRTEIVLAVPVCV